MTETILVSRPLGARLATTAVFLANGSGIGTWAASLPVLKQELLLSNAALALPLFAYASGSILAMPLTGALSRFGSLRLMIAATACFGFSLALMGLAGSLPVLALLAFLLGAGNGIVDVSMNTYATAVQRAWGLPLMSSFHAAFSLGGLVGAAGTGALLAHGLSPAGCFTAAALWILALAIAARTLGENDAELGPVEAHGHGFVLPTPALLGIGLLCFLSMLIEGALADWSGVYLATVAGATASAAAMGYAAFSVTMAAGRTIGDRLVSALGAARVARTGAVVAAGGITLALAVPIPVAATFGFALVGIGVANVVPLLFSAAGRSPGTAPGMGIAMAATVGYAGFLLGPPLIGCIADAVGLRLALVVLVVSAIIIAAAGRAWRP